MVFVDFSLMVRFLEIFLKEFLMKPSLLAVIAGVIGIIAIVSVLLTASQESDVIKIEDELNRELMPIDDEIPEITDKLDEIEKVANENETWTPKQREWQTSGKFQIDRKEYILGEKIFLRVGALGLEEKGQVAFLRPLNATTNIVFMTISFDGVKNEGFNYYLEPRPSKTGGICSKDDIIGKWTVVFRGTDYPNLNFEIIDQILPGDDDLFNQVVC